MKHLDQAITVRSRWLLFFAALAAVAGALSLVSRGPVSAQSEGTGTVDIEKVKDPSVLEVDTTTEFDGFINISPENGRNWNELKFGFTTTLRDVAVGTYTLTENQPAPNGWTLVGYAIADNETDECPAAKSAYSPGISSFTVSNLQTTRVCVMNTKGAAATPTPVTPTPVTPTPTSPTPTPVTPTPSPVVFVAPVIVPVVVATATPTSRPATPLPATPTAAPPRPTNTPTPASTVSTSAPVVVVTPAPPRTGSGAQTEGSPIAGNLVLTLVLAVAGGLVCTSAVRRRQRSE